MSVLNTLAFNSSLQRYLLHALAQPIDDLAERAPGKYSQQEEDYRRKTAAVYRLIDLLGWTNGIYGHTTTRVGDDEIVINPFGMQYGEVTASSLVKVTIGGKIVDQGSTNYTLNDRGYTLHSAIHGARHDVICAIHLHTPTVMAFASLQRDFLPLHQESSILGEIAYHPYHGALTDLEERAEIVKSVGDRNLVILKNHGFVALGTTIEEAFHRAYFFLYAVDAQLKMCSVPLDQWEPCNYEAFEAMQNTPMVHGEYSGYEKDGKRKHWKHGQLDWESWMRTLDRLGMRTGHQYNIQTWKN